MNEENLKKLYESASVHFDMPNYDQFVLDMQDDVKISAFRESMSKHYDMPDIDTLKNDMGLLKKKDATELPSEDGLSESQENDLKDISEALDKEKESRREATKNFAMSAISNFNNMLVSIPAGIQDLGGFLMTPVSMLIGKEAASSEGLKDYLGVDKTLSDYYKEEQERYKGKAKEATKVFMEDYEAGIMESIEKGNYSDALDKTFFAGLESAPVSLAMMAGGSVTSLPTLVAGSTAAFFEPALDELRKERPESGNAQNIIGALTMASAESVFSSINAKAMSSVYKSIIKKEGLEVGTQVFRKTLLERLTAAMAKYGAPVAALSEGLEEVATLATQNAVKGKPIFEGAADAFIVGSAMGGVMTAPVNAAKAVNAVNGAIDKIEQKKVTTNIVERSKYKDIVDAFSEKNTQELDSDQLDLMSLSRSESILKDQIKEKIKDGDLTKEEGEAIISRFNESISINSQFEGLELTNEQKIKLYSLIKEKKSLENKIKGKDQNLVNREANRIKSINEEIKNIVDTETTEATPTEEAITEDKEPFVTEEIKEKVSDVIGRPITLTSLGGSKLETPIDGEVYVDGQQVVVEDADGNITEIGNVDEISDSTLEDIGIIIKEPDVKTLSDGNLEFEGTTLVPNKKGIKRNKRGEINRVVLTNEKGDITKTLRGANAEEAAYQILLKEATSPEQAQFINEQLENDAEFQNEFTETTEPTQAETNQDTGQTDKQAYVKKLKETKEKDPKNYWTVSEVDQQTAESGTLIDDADGSALVKEDGDIVGVFKNLESKAKGVAQKLLAKAVEAGGTKLDNFDNYLTPIYEKAGFRVAGRVAFDENFAPPGWKPEFGKPDVVAMVYDPNNELNIEEKTFDNYDDMISYRDSFISDEISTDKETVPEIVQDLKQKGVEDKKILDFLRDKQLNIEEGASIISEINEKETESKQKDEGLFDPNKNIVRQYVGKVFRKFLSGRGFVPKTMQILREYKSGAIEAEVRVAKKNVKRIERAVRKYKDPKTVIESIDKFMRGDENHNLPEEMIGMVSDMRTHLDNLSKNLADSGVISDIPFDELSAQKKKELIDKFGSEESARTNYKTSKQNVLDNIGSYLNRSYEVYDNKNYAKKVTDEIKQSAKNKLREIYSEYAIAESERTGFPVDFILNKKVDQVIDGILNQDEANEFVIKSKEGAKNLSTLEQRKDIPAEIRALMGEYGDPAMNYVRSIQNISALIANQSYQKQLRKNGEGVYLFTEPTGIYNVKIAGESSESMNILAGMYTTKDIADAMANGNIVNIDFGPLQGLYDSYLKMVGLAKYSKTILSIGTHSKNIIGNIPFMIMTGNFNLKEMGSAISVLKAEYSKSGKKELSDKMDEYTRLGIINQSTSLGEIRELLGSGKTFEDLMIQRAKDGKLSRVGRGIKKFLTKDVQAAYQVEDDFFKIAAYENEKRKYAKIALKKDLDQLTEQETKEASERAATIVKNVLPNYGRVGGYVKLLKAIPVAGTFISFTSESVRTSYNTVDLAMKEIRDPKTREIGIRRLGGIMALTTIKAGLISLWGMSSGDDDSEDEAIKNARQFLPFWDTNSTIVPTQIKDGVFKYRSISASDPHGYMDKVFNAYMNSETFNEGLINALGEASEPWTNSEMTGSVLFELATNKDRNGRKIILEGDDSFDVTEKVLSRLGKVFMPGTVTSASKIFNADGKINEAIGQFTGFKEHKVDVVKSLGYKSLDIKSRAAEAGKGYSKAKRDYERGEISLEELRKEYDTSNERKRAVYEEAIKIYKGALYFGVEEREAQQKMIDWGIPKYIVEGIVVDQIPDMKP